MTIQTQQEIRDGQLTPFTVATQDANELTSMTTSNLLMQGGAMERIFKFAEIMATGKIATPKHLQGAPADCLAIVLQATRWNMDPFAVAQKTHIVNGVLGYEAQLVNAVVQACGAIDGRFHYEHRGDKGAVECRVGAILRGEKEITWGEWLCERDVTTKNSPLWKMNVPQQMSYLQTKNWARMYTPGAILGVYTPDELDSILPPQHMGSADVVNTSTQAANEPAHPKLAAADAAAALGVAAYAEFFKNLTKEERQQLAPGHEARKTRATEVDANRTVDNATEAKPTPTAAPAQAAAAKTAPAGGPSVTYASVMDRMINAHKAKDQTELDTAADLIGSVPDAGQRKELEDEYERMTAEVAA